MRLLLTDYAASTHRQRLHDLSDHVDVVRLSELAGAGSAQIDAAFFSPDCYPELAANFMVAVLDAPRLSWLHTFSTGTDHPIFATLIDRGVRVTNSSGGSAVPISHAVAMHLLALSRRLPETIDNQRRRQWSRLGGRDLQDSTTVVLGFGPIGQAVARLMPAFGSRVIALRRNVGGTEPCETWPLTRLHEALAMADQLVIALPATPETIGILDRDAFDRLPDHALIVNVGRGELIDEAALVAASLNGRISGAALDVFNTEPLPIDSPLWDLPNVIVTPHIAARTPATDAAAVDFFFTNLAHLVGGEPMINDIQRPVRPIGASPLPCDSHRPE